MKASSKKDKVAQFVTGTKQSKAPKPKSLTPKVKASDNKKRAGRYGKAVEY